MSSKKKLMYILFSVALLGGCGEEEREAEEGSEAATMIPGTYTAVSNGYNGEFDVSVTVDESTITEIVVGENSETESVGGKALSIMEERIIENNTAGVDFVSGATVTSMMFRSAVQECLTQAEAPDSLFESPAAEEIVEETVSTEVLVIGSGAAGFSAAIAAAENGAEVTMIEKQDIIGGSALISAGIVYAALDEDDYSDMIDYYTERAEGNVNEELLETYVENSIETIEFLEDIGVSWMMEIPSGTAPQPRARFSMKEDGEGMIGEALIIPLESRAEDLGITLLTGVEATELIQGANGAVTGARALSKTVEYTFEADAVVVATGGFDASEEMKEEYAPDAMGDVVLSSKGNTGDGIVMGEEVGAATEFKNGVIGFISVDGSLPDIGYSSIAMGANAYVQPDGTYVMNPIDYPITYSAIKETGSEYFYGLFDSEGAEMAQQAIDRGFGYSGETVEELAEESGMDASNLEEAIAESGNLTSAPYYAVEVKPSTIGSMGGLVTNTESQVLSEADGDPIPGLFAAGEVANSGFYYNEYPASGSSIGISITYGLIAGEGSAEFALGD